MYIYIYVYLCLLYLYISRYLDIHIGIHIHIHIDILDCLPSGIVKCREGGGCASNPEIFAPYLNYLTVSLLLQRRIF